MPLLYPFLAIAYNRGEYAAAEERYLRSLAIKEKQLGPEHPEIAFTLNNLATLYQAQHKYAAARPLYARSVAIFRHALGENHPHVITCLHNYADLLRAMGEPMAAQEIEAHTKEIGVRMSDDDE